MNIKGLSLCLLLLILSSTACAQLDTGHWVAIYPSRGLNVHEAATNLDPSEAMRMEHFFKQGYGIRQIPGLDNDNTSEFYGGAYPVRQLYRYYNEESGIEQTIAVCGPIMYYRDDTASTYKILGVNDDSVTATMGDSMVHGIGTNWNSLKGESDGSTWYLYLQDIDQTWHPIKKIHSDILIELSDIVSNQLDDTGVADIALPAGTGYVDFATFQNKLFIANGTDEVRSWDGSTVEHGAFIVDSFYVDSAYSTSGITYLYWYNDSLGLTGPTWYLDTLGNPDFSIYQDSSYCVIIPDSNSTIGYSRPHPITVLNMGWVVPDLCAMYIYHTNGCIDDGCSHTMTKHTTDGSWAYITKPMFPAHWRSPQDIPQDYTSLDTVVSSVIEHAALDRDSTNNVSYIWIYDGENEPDSLDYYSGAYGFCLTYPHPDSISDIDDSIKMMLYKGITFVPENRDDSIYYKISIYRDADVEGDEDTIFDNDVHYQIVRYNYAPRGAQFVETHRNRLWCANFENEDDKVMYSAFNDATSYYEEGGGIPNYFYINKGADTYINQISSKWGQLYFYTDRSIWSLYGVDNYDFELRMVFDGAGCQSPYSLVSLGGDYFFFDDGMYYFDGSMPKYMCAPVQEIFTDSMNRAYKNKVTASIFDNRLWIGYPDGSDTNISAGLVYDFDGFWSTVDTPFVGGGYVVKQYEDDADTALIGNAYGWIYRYDGDEIIDRYSPDVDTFVNALYQSPWMSFERPYDWKQISRLGVEYSKSDSARIVLQLFADGDLTDTLWCDSVLATDTDTRGRKIFEIPHVVNGYNFSVLIKGERARSLDITKIFMKMRYIREDN